MPRGKDTSKDGRRVVSRVLATFAATQPSGGPAVKATGGSSYPKGR